MLYGFHCKSHGDFDIDLPIGTAGQTAKCPDCGVESKRTYTSCNFLLVGGGWPGKSNRLNSEMTQRNERAGARMRKEHGDGPVKTVAHDYGGGDIREVK
jgi:hypothetical protein